jgi:protein OS-9
MSKWHADREVRNENAERKMDADLERIMQGLQSGQLIFDADANGDIREAKPHKPRIVGGIEIGGHNVIPKGKKIEKSVVVGGGKETLIATIARSDGFVMSDRELRGFKIPGGKEVEAVKLEVERVAQGKSWRLDIVETPRGRELRGIIDNEDEGSSEMGDEGGNRGEDGDEATGEMGSEEGYKEEL